MFKALGKSSDCSYFFKYFKGAGVAAILRPRLPRRLSLELDGKAEWEKRGTLQKTGPRPMPMHL